LEQPQDKENLTTKSKKSNKEEKRISNQNFFDFALNLTRKRVLAGERPPSVLGSVVFLLIFVTSTKAK
jgi:hypothetical protein